jgi:hypothetical protein
MRKGIVTIGLVLVSAALGPPARADASAAVYQEARALQAAGKYPEAIAKLKAAYSLMPTVVALLSLADAYEKNGQTASAYGAWREAGILARRLGETAHDVEAHQRGDKLEPLLSKLLLDVAAGNRGAGVTLKEDGREIPEAAWGTALPLDSGEHTVEASAPGKQTWKATVRIGATPGTTTTAVPVLEAAATPEAQGGAGAAPFWGPRRIAGLSVGGAGIVSIAVGAILGVLSGKQLSLAKSEGNCNAALTICNQTGLDMDASAKTLAHGSTATFVIGGAAVAAGVVLWATAPSAGAAPTSGVRVTVGPVAGAESGGVLVRGAW